MVKVPLVSKRNGNSVCIDNSDLFPGVKIIASKDFKRTYRSHVEKLILQEGDTYDFERIIPILIIVEYMDEGVSAIYLDANLREVNKRKVIEVLREVIGEHYSTLVTIMNLYKGKMTRK